MNGNSDQIRGKLSTKIVNTMLAIVLVLGLSPFSKASASVANDSSQSSTAQVAQQSADGASEGVGDSAELGEGASADSSSVVAGSDAAAATLNNQSAENVTGGGASGAIAADNAATAPQPTNQPATQNGSNNAVAAQAETYNPDAEPRKVTQGLTVGVYKDKDCNESLGDEAVSTDTLLYGKVNIDFSSDEAPSLASPNICYEFPKDQIDVPNQAKATLYDGAGAVAGSWYIEDGIAHLKYSEDWLRAHQSGIIAHFNFEFTLGLKDQGDGKSETITFPGATAITTVNTKDGNVGGDKFGKIANQWNHEWQPSFDASDNSYTWTVKVSPSSYATGLVVKDTIGQNLDFVEGSFSLVDASGNPASGKCDVAINGKTASISLGDLPKGDYYVQYKTVVSEEALKSLKDGQQLEDVGNKASWTWGSNGQNKNDGVNKDPEKAKYSMVSKSASGNADDIVWTVKLNTGNFKADMSNYEFSDALGEGHSFKEGSRYEVKDASGNVVASGKVDPNSGELNFTLPDNIGKQELTVTYHTVMDDASSEVSNEAKVTPPASSIYPEGSGTAKFKPADDETYITKELLDANTASVDGYATWKSTIDFTKLSGDTDPSSIVFYDKIEKTAWTQHMTFDQIEVSIEGEVGLKLVDGEDYSVSKNGQCSELEIAFKNTNFVKSLLGPNGHDVVVSYRTHSDASNDVYTNTSVLRIGGLEKGRASASYTSKKSEIPAVSKKSNSIWWDANYDWGDGSAKGAWIANWSVAVNKTNMGNQTVAAIDLKGQPIVVTDSMDEGMAYVDGSAQYNLISSDSSNLSRWQQRPEVKTVDGKTVFTIATDQSKTETGATNVYAELSYNTAIKPSLIEAGATKDFSNKAEAKSGETEFPESNASASVTNKVLDKTSQRAGDNSHVTYTIKVNEHAQDLVADSDVLTLVDEMSSTCSFTNSSLHVMSGTTDITSNVKYTLENATNNDGLSVTRLTLLVPDSTALTITYDVSPQGAIGDTVTIDNTVSLAGFSSASSHNGKPWKIQKSNAGTEAQSFGISIKKTDETGNNPLKGANFSLFKVDLDASTAENIVATAVEENKETNDVGVVEFGSQESPLNANILYYYIETEAPDGYEITNIDPAYVLFSGVSSQDKADYAKVLAKARALGIEPGQGTSYNVYNKKSEAPAPKGSATLSLKKTVNNTVPADNQSFEFKLSAITGGAPMPAGSGDVVSTSGLDAEKSFGEIAFDTPGTYKYKIEETSTAPNDGNVWSMAAPVYAQVKVDSAVDGKLPTSVKYYSDEGCTQELSGDKAVFNNTWKAPAPTECVASINITKTVNGSTELKTDEGFEFQLFGADDQGKATGSQIGKTVTVKPGQKALFDAITFDKEGAYNYVIHEVKRNDGGWIAHEDVPVSVTVTKDASENKLNAVVNYGDGKDAVVFDNTYQAVGSAVLSVVKKVNGKELKTNRSFSFELTPVNGAPMPEGKDKLEVSTTGSEASSFGSLQFSLADAGKTYKYRIHEMTAATDGWTMAGDVFALVKVGSDQGGGKLGDATVEYVKTDNEKEPAATDNGSVVFDNQYATSTSAQIKVSKAVEGGTDVVKGENFTFELRKANDDGSMSNDVVGTATAKAGETATFEGQTNLTYTTADAGKTFTYWIHETGHDAVCWQKDSDAKVTVEVTESDDLSLSAKVSYGNRGTDAALFTNKYIQASGGFKLELQKTVNDGVPGRSFDFKVEAVGENAGDAPKFSTDSASSDAVTGKADFGTATLSDKDKGKSYTYKISEMSELGNGWKAANSVYAFVSVSKDASADNHLGATVTYSANAGGTDSYDGPAKFNNAYEATGSVVLSVKKLVNGGVDGPTGSSFTFQLKQQDGTVASEATAKAGETARFESIGYTLADADKEFTYTISEVGGNDGAWFAADDVTATVKVSDNGDGTLATEVAYSNAATDGQQAAALFDNAYAPASATLQVKKLVNGAEPAADQRFDFELLRDASNPASANVPWPKNATAAIVGSAPASFAPIEFTEPGEYRYVIHETSDMGEGWTNAPDVSVTVKVVRDEQARTLKVKSVDYGEHAYGEGGQQMALFDNKYEQPKQPGEDTPKGETPQQPGGDTPSGNQSDQPKASTDGSASSGVKTGDSLALVGGGVALAAVVAAAVAWFASRRKTG